MTVLNMQERKNRIGALLLSMFEFVGGLKLKFSDTLSGVVSVDRSMSPEVANVTMTLADTEYEYEVPNGAKQIMFHTRDGTSFRYAWTNRKVATPTEPYITVPANTPVNIADMLAYGCKLYMACAAAAKVVEIECWV